MRTHNYRGCAILWIILVLAFVLPCSVRATLMLYTLSANASGAVGTTGFYQQTLTISAIADTSQIQPVGPTFGRFGTAYSVLTLPGAVISLAGSPVATLTGDTYVFASDAAQIWGINDINSGGAREGIFEMGFNAPLGNSYDLSTPIGPVLSNASVNGQTRTGSFPTSAGYLYLISWSTGSFQAQVVPEPNPGLLAMTGCALILRGRKFSAPKKCQSQLL